MAFYKQDIVDVNLETGVIHRSFLNHTIGHKDDDADRFGIRAFRNGDPVDLSGAQCQAVFMAPDGTNIALTSYGTVSGNEAYVTLPQACYNVEGQFCLAIKLVGGGVTATVRIIDGVVDRTGTTGAVAPTEAVPTYQEILAVYADMQEDVADYESVVATQNGKIDDLKSALELETDRKYPFISGYWSDNGVYTPGNLRICSYNHVPIDLFDFFELPTGYSGYAILFDASMTKLGFYGYNSGNYTTVMNMAEMLESKPTTKYYVVNIRKDDTPTGDIRSYLDYVNKNIVYTLKTDHKISLLEENKQFNAFDMINGNMDKKTDTNGSVKYTWNGNTCHAEGSNAVIYSHMDIFTFDPISNYGLQAGDKLHFLISTEDSNLGVKIFWKIGSTTSSQFMTGNTVFTIPTGTTRIVIRVETLEGATVDDNITVYILNAYTNKEIENVIQNVPYTLRGIPVVNFPSETYNTLGDLPKMTFAKTLGASDRPNGIMSDISFYVLTFSAQDGNYNRVQYGFTAYRNSYCFVRYMNTSGVWQDWHVVGDYKGIKSKLKVLCIGNSYTRDNMSYVPYIMEQYTDAFITLGISYYSGASIDNYYNFIQNDSAVLTYNKKSPTSTAWTAVNNKTLKQILADEDWDIITFQQASSYAMDWDKYSNLNNLIDEVINYKLSVHSKPVKLGWLMPQIRESIKTSSTFGEIITCINNLLDITPIDFVLPCGTAIENARGTSLNSLGDSGALAYDSNGHLQEGLPCLIGAYASAYKLLELMGTENVGIIGDQIRPTASWISSRSIPEQHGTSTGVTGANCILGQKCAVASLKFPEKISTIV